MHRAHRYSYDLKVRWLRMVAMIMVGTSLHDRKTVGVVVEYFVLGGKEERYDWLVHARCEGII